MRIIFEDKDFGRNASVKCPDNIHTEMYIAMDKRIRELEAQVQELIEELQDVVCFAPECTTSKEYAVKRLEELMSQYVFLDNKWEAKKMIGEFERVMISASKMYGSLVNTLLLDLANAHLLDIAAKDERIAVLEQITQHPLYEHLVKAEARIRELEGELEKRGSWGKLKNMDHKIIEFELGEDHKCGFNFFYEKTTQIWNCFLSREMMDDFCNLPSRFNGIRVS